MESRTLKYAGDIAYLTAAFLRFSRSPQPTSRVGDNTVVYLTCFDRVGRWEEIAVSLLRKYCDRNYKHRTNG